MKKKELLAAQAAQLKAENERENREPVIEADSFEVIGDDASAAEAIARPSLSFWKDAMRRLSKNKVALVCAIYLVFIILMAVIVPIVSPYTMSEMHGAHSNAGMFYVDPGDGHMHIFGTDSLGRDVFVRIWDGARVSMIIAFAAVGVNFIVGIIYGGISGYFGGALDNVMMRIVEIVNGIPYLIIVILCCGVSVSFRFW